MIRFVQSLADRFARFALAPLALAALAACSGAVGPSTVVNDPTRITVLPATATAFSGLPITFTISGGTGVYIVASSNQSIIQVSGSITGGSLTVFPSPVLVDTTVTLTVRDTGTTPTQTATVTVKPGTVSNNITITPSSTQGGSCAPAICSGSDALVSATIAQGGIPLAARGVRFEVVSGDFRFITSAPGQPETLDTSIIVITDETGKAQARIRVLADAPNQTALLEVTDLGNGAFQRASFVIAQTTGTSPGFFVTPTSVTFQGRLVNQCADGGNGSISATFFIFGGSAPYTVSSSSSAFFVSPNLVSSSGGSFTLIPNGTCVATPGIPIVVRDSSGHTTTVTAANIPGTQTNPPLLVAPAEVTLTSCKGSASVTIAGGRGGGYFVSSGSDAITVSQLGNTFTITRAPTPSPAPGLISVNVGVSDGTSVVPVKVNFVGAAAAAC